MDNSPDYQRNKLIEELKEQTAQINAIIEANKKPLSLEDRIAVGITSLAAVAGLGYLAYAKWFSGKGG